MVPFTGDRYESIHQIFIELMNDIEKDEYHGVKLKALLKKIADGQSVILFATLLSSSSC